MTMLTSRARVLWVLSWILAVPAVLAAQRPTTAAGQVAGIAPPPAGPVVPPPGTVFYNNVSIAVFPDGRVFANFGRGYEQVVRACGENGTFVAQVAPVPQPVAVQPTVTQPTVATSPMLPNTQPVPVQQTPPQQVVAPTQPAAIQPGAPPMANAQPCWTRDSSGQIVVSRP